MNEYGKSKIKQWCCTWRAMELALQQGKVRAIGVSNFESGRFMDLTLHNDIVPAMMQVQTNVYTQQQEMADFLKPFGTKMTAWSPLTQGDKTLFVDPILGNIAEKYGKTIPQVALRYLIERGICILPKSTHRERMEQNFDIFNFSLSTEDMTEIAKLNKLDRGQFDFDDPKFVKWISEAFK